MNPFACCILFQLYFCIGQQFFYLGVRSIPFCIFHFDTVAVYHVGKLQQARLQKDIRISFVAFIFGTGNIIMCQSEVSQNKGFYISFTFYEVANTALGIQAVGNVCEAIFPFSFVCHSFHSVHQLICLQI